MKVSVITICFNSQDTIEDTIKSVISQDYKDIEYIIVDGNSKDNTKIIIQKYKSKLAYYISEPDLGIYDAMNKGIAASCGDVIAILNSDDVYAFKSVVSEMVNALGNNDAVYADLVYVGSNNLNSVKRAWKAGSYKKGLFYFGWMPPHPTFFVKKKCYDELGTYSLDLNTSSDYELMLRFIHKFNISISYLQKTIVKMRLGGASNASIKNRLLANREDKKAWKINGLKPKAYTFLLKPLRKLNQFRI